MLIAAPAGTFSRLPEERSSIIFILAPASKSCFIARDAIKLAPPATATFLLLQNSLFITSHLSQRHILFAHPHPSDLSDKVGRCDVRPSIVDLPSFGQCLQRGSCDLFHCGRLKQGCLWSASYE